MLMIKCLEHRQVSCKNMIDEFLIMNNGIWVNECVDERGVCESLLPVYFGKI